MTKFTHSSNREQDNLAAILESTTYKIAHEDSDLLNSNTMRGVRMLLEITKPDLYLEAAGIESTIIVFGGARIVDQETAGQRLKEAEQNLQDNPDSSTMKRIINDARHSIDIMKAA